jgi:hypothetical protein
MNATWWKARRIKTGNWIASIVKFTLETVYHKEQCQLDRFRTFTFYGYVGVLSSSRIARTGINALLLRTPYCVWCNCIPRFVNTVVYYKIVTKKGNKMRFWFFRRPKRHPNSNSHESDWSLSDASGTSTGTRSRTLQTGTRYRGCRYCWTLIFFEIHG